MYLLFSSNAGGPGVAGFMFVLPTLTVSESDTTNPLMLCVELDLVTADASLGCDTTVTVDILDGTNAGERLLED